MEGDEGRAEEGPEMGARLRCGGCSPGPLCQLSKGRVERGVRPGAGWLASV